MIEIEQLHFQYPQSDFRLRIDNLSVATGERVAIIGPSGSGKTTLLNLISGVSVPDTGSVAVDGRNVARLSDTQRRDFRIASIGFVFQRFELINYLNVRDNILFPFLINRSLKKDQHIEARLTELTNRVGIGGMLQRYPEKLSQGEKQRVAICRSLILSPPLILADEPTGNLDPANKDIILDLILDDKKRTFVVVTHDLSVADRFDRVIDFSDFYQAVPQSTKSSSSKSPSSKSPSPKSPSPNASTQTDRGAVS